MALLHEIVGTIVASAALTLAIYVFIRTLDYQSYKDADSDYRDVLKIGTYVFIGEFIEPPSVGKRIL